MADHDEPDLKTDPEHGALDLIDGLAQAGAALAAIRAEEVAHAEEVRAWFASHAARMEAAAQNIRAVLTALDICNHD